jgi:hypothetical protein
MWGATDHTYLRMQYDSVRALGLPRYVFHVCYQHTAQRRVSVYVKALWVCYATVLPDKPGDYWFVNCPCIVSIVNKRLSVRRNFKRPIQSVT